ncbi:MAG: DUF434 domain-containing protein [Chitinophagales bacterium]|nr:DUF434 domain-containing protein [Chitinophagales bacterium]
MPDNRKHRGQYPADAKLFLDTQWPKLQQAVRDLSWLLSHGYVERSALKLVGDRYRLKERQRLAVMRSACSHQAALHRRSTELDGGALKGQELHLDGFNVLISIESALSKAFLLDGVDSCYRDIASIHGTYRRVAETKDAILLAGYALNALSVEKAIWYFDKPVSNSGRLKQMVLEVAASQNWNWDAHLHFNPDKKLIELQEPIASSDGIVLDKADSWFNFARFVIDSFVQTAKVLPMAEMTCVE